MNSQNRQYSDQGDLVELSKSHISELINVGRWIDQQGWCPATSGNFSVRIAGSSYQDDCCLITASGVHKGQLNEEHFVLTDLNGELLDQYQANKPSAETLIHLMLYRLSNDINAVLHVHSIPNTVLSQLEQGSSLKIQGLEMQKSIDTQNSHEDIVKLVIIDNTQDMRVLSQKLKQRWFEENGLIGGFLVRGHGAYFWGNTIQEAKRHLEGIEFILACMLELKRFDVSQRIQ